MSVSCPSHDSPLTGTEKTASAHSAQFQELYRQHNSWLIGWLCRKTGCPHNAADFAQDTFIRLFTFGGLTGIREPRAFLTTTATRLLIDDNRRKQVERSYMEAWSYYNGEEATAPSAEELTLITETLSAIVAMLEGLPEKCQKAFLMSRLDGLGHAEIAQQLGVSKSMVKQYMAKAMLHCYQVVFGDE